MFVEFLNVHVTRKYCLKINVFWVRSSLKSTCVNGSTRKNLIDDVFNCYPAREKKKQTREKEKEGKEEWEGGNERGGWWWEVGVEYFSKIPDFFGVRLS